MKGASGGSNEQGLERVNELPGDRDWVADVPLAAIPPLLCQLNAVEGALAARLAAASHEPRNDALCAPDRLLTANEVARRAGMSKDYVYRHANGLPFTHRVGRAVRFSENGLNRWLETRQRS